jgi:hypothetical protein
MQLLGIISVGFNVTVQLNVCDGGTLLQVLCFWTLSIVLSLSKTLYCLFCKTKRFGYCILSLSSGKTYSVGLI